LLHQAQETETNPKCYICTSDGRQKFTDNCDVFNHMSGVHLYEYPFECRKNSWCMRAFSNTIKARVHIKCTRVQNTKSKYPIQVKWECYFCGKQFNRQSHLSSHLSCRQFYEKAFRWNFCYAEFYQTSNLRQHVTKSHGYMVQCTVHLSLAMLEREYAQHSSIVFESQ